MRNSGGPATGSDRKYSFAMVTALPVAADGVSTVIPAPDAWGAEFIATDPSATGDSVRPIETAGATGSVGVASSSSFDWLNLFDAAEEDLGP